MEAWATEGDFGGWRVADYASNLQLALSIWSCVELYPWDVLYQLVRYLLCVVPEKNTILIYVQRSQLYPCIYPS